MTYNEALALCRAAHLDIFGAFHPAPEDGAPEGCRTLLLLGPHEPGFWQHLTQSPEWSRPDPVDQWSSRVITAIAKDMGGSALFPFGGPPFRPFISWAKRSGAAWSAPVTLLVQARAGLMVSYRGAIALPERLALPEPNPKPCLTCDQPCTTACPVNALTATGYDVSACRAYLDTEPGQDCRLRGCKVRRACPVSQNYGRVAEQSAYHMSVFHR